MNISRRLKQKVNLLSLVIRQIGNKPVPRNLYIPSILNPMRENKYGLEEGVIKENLSEKEAFCSGCGARFHSKCRTKPGFVDANKFEHTAIAELEGLMLCRRCFLLKSPAIPSEDNHYLPDFKDDEANVIQNLVRLSRPLVILLVDLTSMPFSISDNWSKLCRHENKKMSIFVVGNKIDVLPNESEDYEKYVKRCLVENMEAKGVSGSKISFVGLISAKTAYKVELLVGELIKRLKMNDSITILGHVNSGKSELFNALQRSDLCLRNALHCLMPSTVSNVPGTTVNRIKFPIGSLKLTLMRHNRVVQQHKEEKTYILDSARGIVRSTYSPSVLSGFPMTPDCQYSYRSVDKTIDSSPECFSSRDNYRIRLINENWRKRFAQPEKCALAGQGNFKYCNDTSGFLTDSKLVASRISSFGELSKSHIPCTLVLKPGWTLVIGDLIAIKGSSSSAAKTILALFLPIDIPVSLVRTDRLDVYTNSFVNATDYSHEISRSRFGQQVIADIVLNMIGWISILKPNKRLTISLKSSVGKITTIRTPPLVRYVHRFVDYRESFEDNPVLNAKAP